MIFHSCREQTSHTTDRFPMAFYPVDEQHPRYRMIHHWHPETELLAVRRGKLTLSLDGTTVEVNAGTLVLIPPGTIHSALPRESRYECVTFDGKALLSFLKSPASQREKQGLKTPQTVSLSGAVGQEFDRLTEALMSAKPGFEAEALGAFFGLIHQLMQTPEHQKIPLPRRKERLIPFENALMFLRDHYKEPITLKDLANIAGLSEKYFGEYFKNITGETPIQYLNEYRIEQAAEALNDGATSVTEIALEYGFNDLSYFIKTFRRHYGSSPGAYRKQQEN